VYKINGTNITEIKKLKASDAALNDYFGYSVGIDGTYIVIGAYKKDSIANESGTVYVYKINGNSVTEIKKLIASDGNDFNNFGNSVAINGKYIVVGAFKEGINNTGASYVFKNI
jgi:hypothetical protein